MTGWQMAMELYHAMPTPLADRVPLGDNARAVRPPQQRKDAVRHDEFEMWQRMKREGMSNKQIGAIAGRTERTVRRYINGESHVSA